MANKARYARLHAIGGELGLDHDELRRAMQIRWPERTSLTQLAAGELAEFETALAECLRERRAARPKKRPRWRPAAPGVVRMITDKQCHLIRSLACELEWTASQLKKFLRQFFNIETVEALGTTRNGTLVIERLKRIQAERLERKEQEAARRAAM